MLINIHVQTKYAPICLQIKDSIVTHNKVIVNEFNNFLNSIATKNWFQNYPDKNELSGYT